MNKKTNKTLAARKAKAVKEGENSILRSSGRFVDLGHMVRGLVSSKLLAPEQEQIILSRSRAPRQVRLHPLEYLAELELPDHRNSGQQLDLETMTRWLAEEAGQPYFHIDQLKIDASTVTPIMSIAYAERHQILAVEVSEQEIVVASAQPWHTGWEDNLRHINRRDIRRVVSNPADIRRYTAELYRLARSITGASREDGVVAIKNGNLEQLLHLGGNHSPDANDEHIINIVDWLLQYAFDQRASDIHIEPRAEEGCIRFRIDGVLHTVYEMPAQVLTAVTSRLKILARMNVAEKRKPQDGRLKTRSVEGNEVELRLSTLPTAFGEKLVMRVFDPDVLVKDFQSLGFSRDDDERWERLISQHGGIVLVTGPTGSGKTTTLYSTLKMLATPEVNVCTIEDPIEMVEPAFNQMQIQHNIGLSFTDGVRALLRQDPDIIMMGEIRDLETAEIAIQAALTGHLVFSTLHTNDAPSAIIRLLELGVPDYLIRATVLGIMGQRLVRTLCTNCKKKVAVDETVWKDMVFPWKTRMPEVCAAPVGCQRCRETGYKGRAGIYEIMLLDGAVKDLVTANCDADQLRLTAIQAGMHSMRLSGAFKVATGLTTIEEVLRVTPATVVPRNPKPSSS